MTHGEDRSPAAARHALYAEYDAVWAEMVTDNDREVREPQVIVEVDPALPDLEQRPLVNRQASAALGLSDPYGASFEPLGDGRWQAWPRISTRGQAIRERLARIRAELDKLGERDFEADLASMAGELGLDDEHRARALYASLCNVVWHHADGSRYSCTWRYAGALVARMRDRGEDYLDFYCSGSEGQAAEPVAQALAGRGWTPHPAAD